MNHPISELGFKKLDILMKFLDLAKDGMAKPYDPIPIMTKIEKYEKDTGIDMSDVRACCPQVPVINDAKDFKPYIMASLKLYAELMGLEIQQGRRRTYE
jgi:hypothetical protein